MGSIHAKVGGKKIWRYSSFKIKENNFVDNKNFFSCNTSSSIIINFPVTGYTNKFIRFLISEFELCVIIIIIRWVIFFYKDATRVHCTLPRHQLLSRFPGWNNVTVIKCSHIKQNMLKISSNSYLHISLLTVCLFDHNLGFPWLEKVVNTHRESVNQKY